VVELRFRLRTADGAWITLQAIVQDHLDDPEIAGILLVCRPVGGPVDGTDRVVDLLVAGAPLPEVLGACAALIPAPLGCAAVVALLDEGPVVGGTGPTPALAADDRWWRAAVGLGRDLTPSGFAGVPADLAHAAGILGFRSAWALPLTGAGGEVVGCVVVWVRLDVEPNIAVEHQLRQTRRLAGLVVGEQRRQRELRRQALTDPLTGVGNRSALRRRLDAATGPVTVAFFDLDAFKPVNDTYGHHTGDGVLRVVAERIAASVRVGDAVVRMGGDEFAVVLADGTTPSGVVGCVRRVVAAVERPIALPGGETVAVGVSVGVATGEPSEVVHRADAELYRAKRRRRCVADDA
jgi:diguanylate cyclase (GGDEF)-like protein